jgi:hypothetical protein
VLWDTVKTRLVAAGQRDDGLAALRRAADGFRKLGRGADAVKVETTIRQIEGDPALS